MKTKKTKYDFAVFIGRMQPPHKAHIEIINTALKISNKVIILIGSANQPRTIKNPWTWRDRENMIRDCFPVDKQDSLTFVGIDDTYNDQQWARTVQETVDKIIRADRLTSFKKNNGEKIENINFNPRIGLIGHKKDDSSFYLDMFPQWDFYGVDNIDDIHSTDIRTAMFESRQVDTNKLPTGISNYIGAFMNSGAYETLSQEYFFIKKYKQAWANAPYAPTFVTVDAVVVQSGHVLLVRRRSSPGKGLWACVGGFVNQKERLVDAALRELREETKLKVPMPVLRGSIKAREVYDDPNRSLRGRTITHAFLIELPPGPLPKVKGGDDADKAKWVSLSVFEKMQDQMFEDHYFIIKDMLEKV